MGFRKADDSVGEGVAPDAYHRITNVKGDLKGQFKVTVSTYVTKAARDANAMPIRTRVFKKLTCDLSVQEDLYSHLYAKLKLSREENEFFKDAVDV